MEEQNTYVVLGVSGGLGSAVANELINLERHVIGINRSGKANVNPQIELRAIDIRDTDEILPILKDARIIYNCINIPYSRWTSEFVDLTRHIISLVEQARRPVVVADNLYMYDEETDVALHERLPYHAKGKKGKTRAEMAELYEQAHRDGRLQMVLARAPDYFGPNSTNSSYYGDRVFWTALLGKKASVIGDKNMLHTVCYVKDYARAMIALGDDPQSYGQAWHVPSADAITQEQFVTKVYEQLDLEKQVGQINYFMLWMAGIFNKEIREVKEMYYEFTKPYLVSHEKYEQEYGGEVTPIYEAIAETIEWFRTQYREQSV